MLFKVRISEPENEFVGGCVLFFFKSSHAFHAVRVIIFILKIQSLHALSKMNGVWVRFTVTGPIKSWRCHCKMCARYVARRTCSPVSCGIRVILNTTWKIAAESRGNLIYTWQMDGASRTNANRSHSSRMWQMFVFTICISRQILHLHVSVKHILYVRNIL